MRPAVQASYNILPQTTCRSRGARRRVGGVPGRGSNTRPSGSARSNPVLMGKEPGRRPGAVRARRLASRPGSPDRATGEAGAGLTQPGAGPWGRSPGSRRGIPGLGAAAGRRNGGAVRPSPRVLPSQSTGTWPWVVPIILRRPPTQQQLLAVPGRSPTHLACT